MSLFFVYTMRKYDYFDIAVLFSNNALMRLSLTCIFLTPLSEISCPYKCEFISGTSVLFQRSTRLTLCSFVVYSEIRECNISSFVLLPQNCLGYLRSLIYCYFSVTQSCNKHYDAPSPILVTGENA